MLLYAHIAQVVQNISSTCWMPLLSYIYVNIYMAVYQCVYVWLYVCRTSTMQSRAFSVVGPLVWNGLPLAFRHFLEYSPRNSFSNLNNIIRPRWGWERFW